MRSGTVRDGTSNLHPTSTLNNLYNKTIDYETSSYLIYIYSVQYDGTRTKHILQPSYACQRTVADFR